MFLGEKKALDINLTYKITVYEDRDRHYPNVFDVTLTDNIQYQSKSVDTENNLVW